MLGPFFKYTNSKKHTPSREFTYPLPAGTFWRWWFFRFSSLVGYVKKKLTWTPKILVEDGTSSSSRPIIFRVYVIVSWRLSSPPKEIPKLYGTGPYTISLFACKIVIYNSWRSLFFNSPSTILISKNFPTDSYPRLSVQTVYEGIQVLFGGWFRGLEDSLRPQGMLVTDRSLMSLSPEDSWCKALCLGLEVRNIW